MNSNAIWLDNPMMPALGIPPSHFRRMERIFGKSLKITDRHEPKKEVDAGVGGRTWLLGAVLVSVDEDGGLALGEVGLLVTEIFKA